MSAYHRRHRRHSDFTHAEAFLLGCMTTFVALAGAVWLTPLPADPPPRDRFATTRLEVLPVPDQKKIDLWEIHRGLERLSLDGPGCAERVLAGGL